MSTLRNHTGYEVSEKYREGYDRIDWSKPKKLSKKEAAVLASRLAVEQLSKKGGNARRKG